MQSDKEEKGKEAEAGFKDWLDKHRIPYLYFHQNQESFASFFKNRQGKRPDFMILIPNVGFILVDVKYRKINPQYKTYPLDSEETKEYSSMQRKFNLNRWYAISNEELGYKTWLWIPNTKVIELGITEQISSLSKEKFIPVPLNYFKQIADNDSLGRLFEDV